MLKGVLFAILLAILVLALWGCSAEDGEEPAGPTPQVVFLFSPGGLGDMSYNDRILEGVQTFKMAHPDIDVYLYSPESLEEAERIYTDWLKRPGSNIPVLFTLASSDYEPMVDRWLDSYELTPNKSILLFESNRTYAGSQIHTFQISMYGASYLAGITARECSAAKGSLVILANPADSPISFARAGFIAGFGSECDTEYLADDWTGYVAASQTYRRMSEWSENYGFIFPVAGGSNAGIYRYSRENPDSPLLAGMDIDQSSLSNRITGSVIKNIDRLIYEYLEEWLESGTMPSRVLYGLDSGYVDWLLAPRYAERFGYAVESARPAAIERERNYYENGD